MADTDRRHIDRAAEQAFQQRVVDAVAAIDWSPAGREAAARAAFPEAPADVPAEAPQKRRGRPRKAK